MRHADQLLMHITSSLPLVSRSYKAAADKLANNFGLSHATAWPVLIISRLGNGVRPGMVAEALGLEPPSLVRLIDQLIDAGLVERHDDAHDRRAKTLHLTAEGTHRAAQIEKALIPFRRKLFAHIAPADIEACARVLNGLSAAILDNADQAAGRKTP